MSLSEKINNRKSNTTMYINEFYIDGLWRSKSLKWNNIRQDINIVVGINGAGKTTLLDAIYSYYCTKSKSKLYTKAVGNEIDIPIYQISSFDVPADSKKKGNSPLLNRLLSVVLQNLDQMSFFNYRMIPINYPSETKRVNSRIENFYKLVNNFFVETKKSIDIDKDKNTIVFKTKSGETLQLSDLSAGEKQLLYLLLTVFLMDEKPAILLLDEPELSLHITWQEKLLDALQKLNPACQIIMTTHSPSIFVNGWREHLVFVDNLIK